MSAPRACAAPNRTTVNALPGTHLGIYIRKPRHDRRNERRSQELPLFLLNRAAMQSFQSRLESAIGIPVPCPSIGDFRPSSQAIPRSVTHRCIDRVIQGCRTLSWQPRTAIPTCTPSLSVRLPPMQKRPDANRRTNSRHALRAACTRPAHVIFLQAGFRRAGNAQTAPVGNLETLRTPTGKPFGLICCPSARTVAPPSKTRRENVRRRVTCVSRQSTPSDGRRVTNPWNARNSLGSSKRGFCTGLTAKEIPLPQSARQELHPDQY